MAVVTGTRQERSPDRSHLHIVGVYTAEGTYRTNRQVADSIKAGEAWFSTAGEGLVPIFTIPWCPAMNCAESPYLSSRRSLQRNIRSGIDTRLLATSADHLENLPTGLQPSVRVPSPEAVPAG